MAESSVRGILEDDETRVVLIDAPSSTADYHHQPNSGIGEHTVPSEIEKSDCQKTALDLMTSKPQDRVKATWMQVLEKKWKKALEVFLLGCVTLVIGVVFTVPSIVFVLTPRRTNEVLF